MPEQRPLLIFPEPSEVRRRRRGGGPSHIHFPSHQRHTINLTPKFRSLQRSFIAEQTQVQQTPQGILPEKVIVLETIGTVEEFRRAIERIEGLDWLLEWDEEEVPPDHDFYDEAHPDRPLSGRLYMVMSNQRGMDELIRLWQLYCNDPNVKFTHGLGRFKKVFQHLRDVRRWGVKDRIEETGVLDYWREMVQHQDKILCEAELWFRGSEVARSRARDNLEGVVNATGGQCLGHTVIEEIAYHAAIIEIPSEQVQRILDHQEIELVRLNDVLLFRPSGQIVAPLPPEDTPTDEIAAQDTNSPFGDPVLALLDGMPIENHPLLLNRLIVDDPDNWAPTYPVNNRWHGTGMASLILRGELDANVSPHTRPLYVRPILRPNPYDWRQPSEECMPHKVLQVDLLHRAIIRIMEGEGENEPAAPSVRIINLSVCDRAKPFFAAISPLARLLDWLSWKYKILFIVSAGNHPQDIVLNMSRSNFGNLSNIDRQREIIISIASDARNRRLLAPAESVNALTIASIHSDLSSTDRRDRRCNPFTSALPSSFNAQGHGFKRSIKPDILLPGGRQFLTVSPRNTDTTVLESHNYNRAPGQQAACPGMGDKIAHTRGTSNSTALASRHAVLLYDSLISLRSEPNGQLLDDEHLPVIIKTLLVHGASWGDMYGPIHDALINDSNADRFDEFVTRFLGYGQIDFSRTLACDSHRATVLGVGSLSAEEGHLFRMPLPDSLAGVQAWKRLVVTLAWFTPVNPRHRAYRQAHLWFNKPQYELQIDRRDCHWQTTQRGTVQHEIFEGEGADFFSTGDNIEIQVNCREDAGGLTEPVPYTLALTMETAPELRLPIYEQIRERIHIPVRITSE